jgi:signal transduction histidine kinase
MADEQSRPLPPGAPDCVATLTTPPVGEPGGQARDGGVHDPVGAAEFEIDAGDPAIWRRRLWHDIRHELGTIIMLASAVAVSDDVGPKSKERIDQLLGETRWLDHLLRQLGEDGEPRQPLCAERIRVDALVAEVVAGVRLATPHHVAFIAEAAWAYMDALSLWRAVRNILDNACRAAAHRVDVRVRSERGWISIHVDDDGPGFDSGTAGLASLGLGIVHDLVSGYGGSLEIHHRETSGAAVRIVLPATLPGPEER